jgi:hypothetical protein
MDIWHIRSRAGPGIRLWRNDKENFQVTEQGNVSAILTNPNYTIIDQKYSDLLNSLCDHVSFHKIKIFDFVLKSAYDNYIELNIKHTITPGNIRDKNSEGQKIWRFGGEVFVSGELKNELLKIDPDDFAFDMGFQSFG